MIDCRGEVLLEREGRQIIRCTSHGYVHVHPLYTEEELEVFYRDTFAESTPSPNWAEKAWNIQRWKRGGRILDIGCWEGRQLEEFLRLEGWTCEGIELNTRAADAARQKGIRVFSVSLREFFTQFAGRTWDVINLAYVLEHVPDPADVLSRLRRFLAPDGILVVEVPNEFNPLQLAYLKTRQREPYWIALPVHLNYFDQPGLGGLVQRCGYDIVRGETTFPMEMFLLMGDDYLDHPEIGPGAFQKVVQMEAAMRAYSPDLVSRMYGALYHTGIGRGLILYLRPRH